MSNSLPSPQLAAQLLLERRQARTDLYAFTRLMFRERRGYAWQHNWHHQVICDALMRVYRGECNRLIINVPPRYSKTELAVVNFIAWTLGQAPDAEFIYTSYSARLAANFSWQARELVQHPVYQRIHQGVGLRGDSQAKDEWRTTAGGIVYAVGAGGTITGYGAGKQRESFGGAIIIDDPHKADEARSDVIRGGVIDWFQNTLESRKNDPKRTPVIVIMQRLHELDLAGWLLAGKNGEHWEHVCLAAIQDDGTALWPEKHDEAALKRMQRASPYVFAGQYQQRPSPAEGNIFRPEMLQIVDAVPAGTTFRRGWDFAASIPKPGKDPDWTVGGKLGKTPDGRWIIADLVRVQAGPHDVRATVKNTAERDGSSVPINLPQDPGQAGKAQAAEFTSMLSGYSVSSSPVTGDKVVRANPFAAQVNVGNVMMLRASWNDVVIEEMRTFPNGAHDDIEDALAEAFNGFHQGSLGMLEWIEQEARAAAERRTQQEKEHGHAPIVTPAGFFGRT